MTRVIISGATGAIGTALIKELIDNRIEVLVLVRPDSKRKSNIIDNPLVSVLECGMEDYAEAINSTGKDYDIFYHLAWAGTIGTERNDMYLQNLNVRYALDAVGMAQRFGCKKFIGIGSQAEYGRYEGMLKPDTPTHPENGYGIAKLCAGHMSREYAHQLGMEHIWVRVLSVYGPGDGAQSMVMSTIAKLKRGEVADFTKGEQLWDYLYSEDAAAALYALGEKGVDGKTYVLGSGDARPLKEYIEIIKKQVDPDGDICLGAIQYSDKQVMHLQADIAAVTEDTGWKPKTRFEDGIINTIKSVSDM